MFFLLKTCNPEAPSARLHTDTLIDPRAKLLVSKYLPCFLAALFGRGILRIVTIDAKLEANSLARTAQYFALALLRPAGWSEEVRRVHRLVTNPNDGLLVGKTFAENGFSVRQNRLRTGWIPWFLIPRGLRNLIPRRRTWWPWQGMVPFLPRSLRELLTQSKRPYGLWCTEVYTLYVQSAATGEVCLYGTFVEVAPAPRNLPARPQLGREEVWHRHGLRKQFFAYLSGSGSAEVTLEHQQVAKEARRTGRFWARFAFPALVIAAFLAQYRCGRSMGCLEAVS